MNITPAALEAEYRRALAAWPFIPRIEATYGLPALLLFAVGSRETNLTNEVGDGGHGHGVWQLDDRSHVIPSDFDSNVLSQAAAAANMLHALLGQYGNLDAALDAYNSGRPTDAATTGGDYGPDVIERLHYLQGRFSIMPDISPPAQIVSLCAFPHPTFGWSAAAVDASGAVYCSPGNAYQGGANGKKFFAGRTAAKITATQGGYMITDTAGETYAFPTTAQ